MNLDGKAIVTGAGAGIGRGYALALAAAGFSPTRSRRRARCWGRRYLARQSAATLTGRILYTDDFGRSWP